MSGDVVICGLPRSGSTLACELLNKAPGVVALDEPLDASVWLRPVRGIVRKKPAAFDADRFLGNLDAFFADTRRALLEGAGARSKHVGGAVSGRKIADERMASGLRPQLARIGEIETDKELGPDFVLGVKHNAGFAATLEHLAGRLPCYAIVRNPLAILASWQTVAVPIQDGRVPFGEMVDPSLASRLDRTPDVVDRQLIVLDWFFTRFRTHIPREATIGYEDIISTNGRVLATIAPGAGTLAEELSSRNTASVYDPQAMQVLGKRLLDGEGPWWTYYSRDDVRALIEGEATT